MVLNVHRNHEAYQGRVLLLYTLLLCRSTFYMCMNLMLVGCHKIGKTSLLQKLCKEGRAPTKPTVSLENSLLSVQLPAGSVSCSLKCVLRWVRGFAQCECLKRCVVCSFHYCVLKKHLKGVVTRFGCETALRIGKVREKLMIFFLGVGGRLEGGCFVWCSLQSRNVIYMLYPPNQLPTTTTTTTKSGCLKKGIVNLQNTW